MVYWKDYFICSKIVGNTALISPEKLCFGPQRAIYFFGAEKPSTAPNNYPSLAQLRDELGEPNALSLPSENPETQEGRNIIRGQAIFMLRRFQYDENNRDKLTDLDELIQKSMRADLKIKLPDETELPDAQATATALKKALDEMRENYRVNEKNEKDPNGKFLMAPILVIPEDSAIADGRNKIRQAAKDWLRDTPRTAENAKKWDDLQQKLLSSTMIASGEYYRQHPETKKPVTAAERNNADETITISLQAALNDAVALQAEIEKAKNPKTP